MANLNAITQIINDKLKATTLSDKRFQKVSAFNIAKALPVKKADAIEYIPVELCDNGEGKDIVPDDRYPVMIYHKMNSVAYAFQREQYGNGNDSVVRTAQMSMIVFAQRNLVKLSEDMMELQIVAGIPSKLTKQQLIDLKLNDCTISLTTTDFNSVAISNREYNTKKYYLKPSHIFFEMRYTIECRMKRACINTCTTC